MTLYRLQHSASQTCPGCAKNWLALYAHAGDPAEAAMSEGARCSQCLYQAYPSAKPELATKVYIAHPWWGVDLDRTLAVRNDGDDIDCIGAPIPEMVMRIRAMLAEGKDVRIFTARVAASGYFSRYSQRFDDHKFASQQRRMIEDWCFKHIGRILPVTAVKDFACIAIYDDIAKQVTPNTGRLVEDRFNNFVRDATCNTRELYGDRSCDE